MAGDKTVFEQHYLSLLSYVSRDVHFHDYDRARIPSKALIQKCVDRFALPVENDGEQVDPGNRIDKYLVVDAINRMRHDRVITVDKADGVKFVSLRGGGREETADMDYSPSQDLNLTQDRPVVEESSQDRTDDENDNEEGPSGQLSRERGHSEDNIEDQVHPDEAAARADADAIRYAKGYADMTRGARPLMALPERQSSPIRTPSRKRKRDMAIAASDEEENMDYTSPHHYVNSTPRRLRAQSIISRMSEGQSESPGSRRRSDPTNLLSPSKRSSIAKTVRTARKDTSPPWLHDEVAKIRQKYPDDSFYAENGEAFCPDCNQTFKPQGHSLHNLVTHLRSKRHKDSAAAITDKSVPPPSRDPPDTSHSAFEDTGSGSKISWLQQPLQAFAYKEPRRVSMLREQLFKATDLADQRKELELMKLRYNLKEVEKTVVHQLSQATASIQASDKKNTDHLEHMSDMIKYSKEKTNAELREVKERMSSCEDTVSTRLHVMKQQSDTKMNAKFDDMTGLIARANFRNVDQLEQVKTDVRVLGQDLEDQVQSLSRTLRSFDGGKQELEVLGKKLEETNRIQQEALAAKMDEFEQDSQMYRESLAGSLEELRQSSQEHQVLISRVEELQQINKREQESLVASLNEFSTNQRSLEQTIKTQQNQMDDLEVQKQMQTEELDRRRDSDLAFKSSIVQQMEAQFEVMNKKIKDIEKENEACLEKAERESAKEFKELESKNSERFKQLEKESSKRIRALEKETDLQRQSINRYEKVIPELMKENTALWQQVQNLQDPESDTDDSISDPESSSKF